MLLIRNSSEMSYVISCSDCFLLSVLLSIWRKRDLTQKMNLVPPLLMKNFVVVVYAQIQHTHTCQYQLCTVQDEQFVPLQLHLKTIFVNLFIFITSTLLYSVQYFSFVLLLLSHQLRKNIYFQTLQQQKTMALSLHQSRYTTTTVLYLAYCTTTTAGRPVSSTVHY